MSQKNPPPPPPLMGGVRFTANRGHCQYGKLSQVNLDQKKVSRSRNYNSTCRNPFISPSCNMLFSSNNCQITDRLTLANHMAVKVP